MLLPDVLAHWDPDLLWAAGWSSFTSFPRLRLEDPVLEESGGKVWAACEELARSAEVQAVALTRSKR